MLPPFTQGKNQQHLNEFYKHYVNIKKATISQIKNELIDLFNKNDHEAINNQTPQDLAWSRFLTSIHKLGDAKGGLRENLLKPIRKENGKFLSVLLEQAFSDDYNINPGSWNLLYYLINPSDFKKNDGFNSIQSSWYEIQKVDVIPESMYPDSSVRGNMRLKHLPNTLIGFELYEIDERPLHNLSAARALSFLDRKEYAEAIDSFNASGHLKYSSTLLLAQTYNDKNESDDFRRELLMQIVSILRREMHVLEEMIYDVHGSSLKEEIRRINQPMNYGIGREGFSPTSSKKSTSLMSIIFPDFEFSKSGNSFKDGKPIILTENKDFLILNYLQHYERVKNLNNYADFIEDVINEKSGKDMSRYLEEIEKCDLSKYTLFRDSKRKGTKYKLEWNEAKGGMRIDEQNYVDEDIKKLHSFAVECLREDENIAQNDFKNALLDLTNVGGIVKEKVAEMLGEDTAVEHLVDTESEYIERLTRIFKHQKYDDAGKPHIKLLLDPLIDEAKKPVRNNKIIIGLIDGLEDNDKIEVHKTLSEWSKDEDL